MEYNKDEWKNVDDSGKSKQYFDYLDAVTAQTQIKLYKKKVTNFSILQVEVPYLILVVVQEMMFWHWLNWLARRGKLSESIIVNR